MDNHILHSKIFDNGNSSSECIGHAEQFPQQTYRGGVTKEVQAIFDSGEYKTFTNLLRSTSCDKTITIDMARPGGQFGSHFNMEVLSFSLLGYMTRHTVIFDMGQSHLGRWCRFFLASGSCKPHNKSNAYVVERNSENGRVNVHWMVDENLYDHIYMSYSDPELLVPIHNILTHYLRKNKIDSFNLLQKFAFYLWQLPEDLNVQLHLLKTALGVSSPFVGAHIRWGDKKTEALPVSGRVYAHLLREMADRANTRTIFVMSDSRDAVREMMDLLPEYDIKTTTPTSWHGNEMNSFFEMPLEDREDQVRLLILELSMMSQAESVVCTMSSNVCRLLQVLRLQPKDTLIGIDAKNPETTSEAIWCNFARLFLPVDSEIEYCMKINEEWFPF